MKLTKQDLMRLPKERLAEIIVEMMKEPRITHIPAPLEPLRFGSSYCFFVGGPCKHSGGCETCPYNKVTCYTYDGPTISSVLNKEDSHE